VICDRTIIMCTWLYLEKEIKNYRFGILLVGKQCCPLANKIKKICLTHTLFIISIILMRGTIKRKQWWWIILELCFTKSLKWSKSMNWSMSMKWCEQMILRNLRGKSKLSNHPCSRSMDGVMETVWHKSQPYICSTSNRLLAYAK